jgi:hypothetical protein
MQIKNVHILVLIIFFTSLYVLLPTQNSGIDAYGYAALVKYNVNLFLSHHLLYNAFLWILYMAFGSFSDVLPFMILLNGVAGGASLLILFLILKELKSENSNIFWAIFLVASSFGFFRFCTENETYVFPILISLLSTLSFLKFQSSSKPVLLFISGILAALACLFHQIHFWWWFAFVVSFVIHKQYKNILYFLSTALIVPLIYIFVAFFYFDIQNLGELMAFVFADYLEGRATASIGFKNILLFVINLIRTFVQVHGNLILLFQYSFIFILMAFLSVIMMVWGIIMSVKQFKIKLINHPLKTIALIAIFFHLIFALVSFGNAEFMAMIPFLIVILYANFDFYIIRGIILGFAIWNISLALIPNHFFDFEGNTKLASLYKKENIYIFENKPLIENIHFYKTGEDPAVNMYKITTNTPFLVDSVLKKNEKIYTDIFNKQILNRQAITSDKSLKSKLLDTFLISKSDSFSTDFETKYIYRIHLDNK